MNTQVWSMIDLMSQPEFKAAVVANDTKKMNELLFEVGVDTNYDWEIITRLHKPLTYPNSSDPINGPMIQYTQRKDKAWEKYMTTEELIDNNDDVFMKAELMSMNRQSNFSGDLIDNFGDKGSEE